MPDEDEGADEPSTARAEQALRNLGSTLGGWARRVGTLVSEASGQGVSVPDEIRKPLDEARRLRRTGDLEASRSVLDDALERHPRQPLLLAALRLGRVYDFLLAETDIATDQAQPQGSAVGARVAHLLEATSSLGRHEPDTALDALRRAAREPANMAAEDEAEALMLVHLLSALAHAQRGHGERSLRELSKARPRIAPDFGPPLRQWLVRHAVTTMLAEGASLAEAERWLAEDLGPHEGDPASAALGSWLRARILAARGDRTAAHTILDSLPEPGEDDSFAMECRVRVGLAVGLPGSADVAAVARHYRDQDPNDAARGRLWALAALPSVSVEGPVEAPAEDDARAWLAALARATQHSPPGRLDRHLAELAHVALRLDLSPDEVVVPIDQRLHSDPGTAPEELRIFRARQRIARGDSAMQDDFEDGPPVRFRAGLEMGGPYGPDESSPLRDDATRRAFRSGQRALAAAEYCVEHGWLDQAQDLLVECLTVAPGIARARALMAGVGRHAAATRLEDALVGATETLAALPPRVLGVSLGDLQDCLARVIAARERLARPLTIAIMGEFSSGKSTFVNALLGQEIAPMGVLPTTSTINVFRRGPGGGARIHYRDGTVSTLGPDHVQPFLVGLDDREASHIRHVEIERTDAPFGDASVVDTPGLNGLDPFHEQVAREFLDEADAVVWVFSATRGGAASEVGMLNSLRAGGRQVLGVLNKVDTLDASERQELSDYLRQQLGDVLIDVIPLDGQAALRHRVGKGAGDGDPFAAVENALEANFLGRAREVKRAVTQRRLEDALHDACTALETAIAALESRAQASASLDQSAASDTREALTRFGHGLHDGVLAVDDTLTREAMGLGLLRGGRGASRSAPEEQDLRYLDGVMRTGITQALGRALAEVAQQPGGEHLVPVLELQFLEWGRGYVDGQIDAGLLTRIMRDLDDVATRGEAAVRAGMRVALQPLARAFRQRVFELGPAIERLRARAALNATSSPRAEALRLRVVALARVSDLLQATRRMNP